MTTHGFVVGLRVARAAFVVSGNNGGRVRVRACLGVRDVVLERPSTLRHRAHRSTDRLRVGQVERDGSGLVLDTTMV